MTISIEEMTSFCKKKGFVYPSGEIYGGFSGFFDYGHLGVELKNNIKQQWWQFHVKSRQDIVGIDGSTITHPEVWRASGHLQAFEDPLLECKKCGDKIRADHLLEDVLDMPADSLTMEEIQELIKKHKLKCPKCNSDFKNIEKFNLMLKTQVGPGKELTSYLRPETAQQMFTNFRLVQEHARLKLPFGIAQIGKAFRNEISPRDFLFRVREFDLMEFEYFTNPKEEKCPFIKDVLKHKLLIYSAEMQKKKQKPKQMTIKQALDKKIIKTEWHAYWLATEQKWFTDLGVNPKNFRIRQHTEDEKSHYALDTWDLEYNFPFGWKELLGMANRTDFDLKQHMKHSKSDLTIFDEETKKKITPHVIAEPSLGVGRAFLVFLFDAYNDDKKRGNVLLKLHPKLAPYTIAILPLVKNKANIVKKAKSVFNELKDHFNCFYDASASIGRRYARQDEIGTPFCITIDFDSLKKNDCTIRFRDTTKQKRIKIKDLKETINKLINS